MAVIGRNKLRFKVNAIPIMNRETPENYGYAASLIGLRSAAVRRQTPRRMPRCTQDFGSGLLLTGHGFETMPATTSKTRLPRAGV